MFDCIPKARCDCAPGRLRDGPDQVIHSQLHSQRAQRDDHSGELHLGTVGPLAETPDEFKNVVNIIDNNIKKHDDRSNLGQYSLKAEFSNE